MITSIFQKPAAKPSSSPFKPPVASAPKDGFQPGDPTLAFKPPRDINPPGPEVPKPESAGLAATATSSAALTALGLSVHSQAEPR